MVSGFSGYVVSRNGVEVLEYKEKLELNLVLSLVLYLGLMNILIAGSFG